MKSKDRLNQQVELSLQKEGYNRPKVEPKRNMSEALEHLSYAVKANDTMKVEVARLITYFNGQTDVRRYEPVVTFSRSGPQEFANGKQAWWETAN